MGTAGDHTARLDDLQPAYAHAHRQTWFAQWYERNALNLRWLLDDRHLPKTPGRTLRVLELGIGWGGASLCLARAGAYVVGLDDFEDGYESQGLPQMRFLAAQGVHVVRGNVLQVPLQQSSFDVVILNDVLEHLSVPKRLLRAICDLLRPDGLFVMEVPNSVALYKRVRVLCGLSNYFRMEHFFRDDDYRGHIREYTKAEIQYMLEKTGFAPIEIRGVNQTHRPWFESHAPRFVTRPVLRVYDALASLRDCWKDHFCCLARKNALADGMSTSGKG